MSGLAATGPGGAIGGLVTLGIAPAIASNLAVNKILRYDEMLSDEERGARTAGRTAAKVATVAGTISAINTVSTLGVVAGLSGAGIASGLTAVGSKVGGGMVAGAAVTIATPPIWAAVAGLGVFWFLSCIFSD